MCQDDSESKGYTLDLNIITVSVRCMGNQAVKTIMSDWDPNQKNEMLSTSFLDYTKSQNRSWVIQTWAEKMKCSVWHFLIIQKVNRFDTWVLDIETRTEKMKHSVQNFLKLGIIILGYFMGPSPFRKDLSHSCAKAVAMNW